MQGSGLDPLMGNAMAGIRADDENPLDLAEESRRRAVETRTAFMGKVNDRLANFDAFAPQASEGARKRALVDAYLFGAMGYKPARGLARERQRALVATELLGGAGAASDDEFFAEISGRATKQKAEAELWKELSTAARNEALQVLGGKGKLAGDTTPGGVDEWMMQVEASPGYRPDLRADYRLAWLEERENFSAAVEPFETEVQEVWRGMQSGESTFPEIFDRLEPDQREGFKEALAAMARAMPAKDRPTFLANLAKQAGRDLSALPGQVDRGLGRAVQEGGTINWEDFLGTERARMARREKEAATVAGIRARWDFVDDVRRIAEEVRDPVKPLTEAPGFLRAVEMGAYAAPQAVATTLTALIPFAGPVASFGIIREDSYQQIRGELLRGGADEKKAQQWAEGLSGVVAVPSAALERLGASAVIGKLPGLNRLLTKLADKAGRNALARGTIRTLGGGAFETGIELSQDLLNPLSIETARALGQDLPGVEWRNGKDGVLDGYWAKATTTFVAILPLAIMGAAGGRMRDERNRAFSQASDLELRALGLSDSAIAEIRGAEGYQSLDAAVTSAVATADPASETAIDATQELAEEIEARRKALEDAQASGVLPRFREENGEWTVFDGVTGEEIGKAPNYRGAVRLAAAKTQSIDLQAADEVEQARVDFLESTMEAMEATGGEGLAQDFRPGERVTTAQAAAESSDAEARIAWQARSRETVETGDSAMADLVLGQSTTEVADGVRRSVNRMNQGATALTVLHEKTHVDFRRALASGKLTQGETLAVVRAVQNVLQTRDTRRGAAGKIAFHYLPDADADVTLEHLDEAVAELVEAEILRTRKTDAGAVPPGVITRNLRAIGRVLAGRAPRFMAFLRAMRDHFGLVFRRAAAVNRALRSGEIQREEYDAFLAKLQGREEQQDFEQLARDAEARILAGEQAVDELDDMEPFSVGRASVMPTADTRVFQGAEGSPSVIGPASFSISAYHGTPHKVRKFSLEKIGTGEGAQAYGWGLYFADSRAVAEDYASALANIPGTARDTLKVGKQAIAEAIGEGYQGRWIADIAKEKLLARAAALESYPARALPYKDAAKNIREVYKSKGGNLYTVRLNVEDDQLLDWDKPLSEQSEAVQAAIEKAQRAMNDSKDWSNWTGQNIHAAMELFAMKSFRENTPEAVSRSMASIGICGIRYLDGNSRNNQFSVRGAGNYHTVINSSNGQKTAEFEGPDSYDQATAKAAELNGQGSYNYVIFDDADIEIIEENGNPVDLKAPGETAFSVGWSGLADALRGDAIGRIKNPLRRAEAMKRVAEAMAEATAGLERLEVRVGSRRLKKSLQNEMKVRQALRAEELEMEAMRKHLGALMAPEETAMLFEQPVHAALTIEKTDKNGRKYRAGRILSKTAAVKRRPELFETQGLGGHYDGAGTAHRGLFGGSMEPDVLAQELFEEGLISEPYADAMWEALDREAVSVTNAKAAMDAAHAAIKQARQQAATEAKEWMEGALENQAVHFSPADEIRRALALLDGILNVVPAEIRGKVGGYTQLARLGGEETRLAFLRDRLARVDAELEKWLRAQYDAEWKRLLARAKPDKDEAGKRPVGKAGASVHELFRTLEIAMNWTPAEAEAEAMKLEILANGGELTAEEEAHNMLLANMLPMVADWRKADAARRESAVIEGQKIFLDGYARYTIQVLKKREARARKRAVLQADAGGDTSAAKRREKMREGATKTGRSLDALLSLLSFEQVVGLAFGENSKEGNALVDAERAAAARKFDNITAAENEIERLLADLGGGKYRGESLRYAMAHTRRVEWTDFRGEKQNLSELEAITAILMWRQEDGRRHMEGHLDDSGAPVGEWHWRQQDIDTIENQLSDAAKALRLHLSTAYAAEYARLNAIFESLYGVSLPKHKDYSPLSMKPVQVQAGQMLDPGSGMAMSGASLTPGSLRNRMTAGVAEPDFKDALQHYLAHVRQMEHWMAYAPFATESMALLNQRDVGNAIEAHAGPETVKVLRGWVDLFAAGGVRDAAAHLGPSKLFNRMLGRLSSAVLIGRVSVLAIQSTQLGAAQAEMPVGAYVTRLAKLLTGQLGWADALKSPFIQRRLASMPPAFRQAMEGLAAEKPNRLKYAVQRIGESISGADALFTSGTYAIIYDYQLKQLRAAGVANPEEAAAEAAERLVERVAQPVRMGTRSLFENQTTNPMARAMWAFASEPRQKFALIAYRMMLAKQKKGSALSALGEVRFWRAAAVTWIWGGVVAAIIRAAMRDVRDDEDDEWFDERNWDPKRMGIAALTGPFYGIPMLGEEIESGAMLAAGERPFSGTLFSSASQAVPAAMDLVTLESMEGGADEVLRDVESITMASAFVSGTGSAATSLMHIVRDLYGLVTNAMGGEEPEE